MKLHIDLRWHSLCEGSIFADKVLLSVVARAPAHAAAKSRQELPETYGAERGRRGSSFRENRQAEV